MDIVDLTKAKMSFKKVINAWRQAAEDLQLTIHTPFVLTTSSNKTIRFELLIENFGRRLGTIILSTDDFSQFDVIEQHGYYSSALNPKNYSTYDRAKFIDTLNDWGYFGDQSEQPIWYTGHSWT